MSGILGRLLPNLFGAAQKFNNAITGVGTVAVATPSIFTQVRTKIRNNFPRPCERKRYGHSYKVRMTTANGRKVIMRRLLKGRFVLTH